MSDDMDPMAEIRASFFIECEELLEALQDGLQSLDDGEVDSETINVVFRAVHSIKGGAGAFGLEPLVRFAHRYETALDEVRSERMEVTDDAMKLFFQAADHVSDLVRVCRDDEPIPSDRSVELLKELDALIGELEEEEEEVIEFKPAGLSLDLGGGALPDIGAPSLPDLPSPAAEPSASDVVVVFKPHLELFETGNEPFQILRALQELGPCTTELVSDNLPTLNDLEPEKSYFSWRITITTKADEAEIASVFEFVDGLCDLDIQQAATLSDLGPPEASAEPSEPEQSAPGPDVATDEIEPVEVDSPSKALAPNPDDAKKEAAAKVPGKAKAGASAKSVVRVDLDRIERLVNLVGELVINQAMLSQSLEEAGLSPHSDAMNGLEEFQRLTRDIQDSVMMIRAQPVKSLFQRMSRIVRESSSAVGKDVRLITEGENTEVDKTVIERLADPLTHMIRNAVDHGLEGPDARKETGKSAQGVVRLSASHKSGRVVIEVADDGAGINRQRVFEIAVSKGLVAADATLSDSEVDNLLFLPGFSTAKEVSDLSGRGVGMDVVRTAIQALGGRITISSTPGEGTTFSISLPLTLAVLDGMVVEVAAETLVIPLNLVIETLTLNDLQVDHIKPGTMSIRVRGEFLPVYDLGVALGYRTPLDDVSECVVLLISQEDGQRFAVIVDEIRDQRQVVIKGLDESFYRSPGIAAATILGDGQIALILDPTDIVYNQQTQPTVSETDLVIGA
ncbi:MAG: chemotaxis protein CheA [Paracoccaceae bacterium]